MKARLVRRRSSRVGYFFFLDEKEAKKSLTSALDDPLHFLSEKE